MVRPRGFDLDDALWAAVQVFWAKGYEGASLADLTRAMGINRTSLYAAFGNKENLFRLALDRYNAQHMAFAPPILEQADARSVVHDLLSHFADAQTDAPNPPGCLATTAALTGSDASAAVKVELASRRGAYEARLRRRLERAQAEGDLAADQDPADLARFFMTVAHGMAVQATSGASRQELHQVVAAAMRAWPS